MIWPLVGLVMFLPWQLRAVPSDGATAQAMAQGWLAAEGAHLGARFQTKVKAVKSYPDFHVIQLEPEGFIVTSADDELEPVLAFSERGELVPDAESPLWIMLNRDAPARAAHLRDFKARLNTAKNTAAKGAVAPALAKADVEQAARVQRVSEKWAWLKARRASTPSVGVTPVARLGVNQLNLAVAPDGGGVTGGGRMPVRVRDIRIVDGHLQLAHDAAGSVSVLASYDAGQTWQLEESGVVWPIWTAKMPVTERAGWYRLELDEVYDEAAVSLMRNPPPATVLTVMSNDFVSDPGSGGLAGSIGAPSDIRVAPLVKSAWNQSTAQGVNCYNYYTPNNYVCGCVATALSQVMRYWQHPVNGIGRVTRTVYLNGAPQSATTRGGDGSGGAYNWSAMPLNPGSSAYNAAQWQQVGALCYDAGVGVNMQYASGGSGAYMHLCASALTSVFQYSNAKYVSYPGNVILPTDSNLAAGSPVLFGISHSGTSGHAVICDGFGYDCGTLYHHINFGWAGAYNAWYALPLLETPYSFNSIDTIIYNVFPTGTGELIAGRVTTSQGAPVQGAAISATGGGATFTGATDAKGYFGLKVSSARTYAVTASKSGMGSATRSSVVIGTSSTSASGNAMGVDFTLNNNFTFAAVGVANRVWLRWSAPTNSGLPTNTVYIRHRTDGYPANSGDGSLIYSGTAQEFEHADADASGTVTNYYTIWGDDGTPYASLGSSFTATGLSDPGKARVLWTRSTGEVFTWNLKTNGTRKSSAFVLSGKVDPAVWKTCGFADIDGDGASDLLWTRVTGEVVYWLLNTDGTLRTSGYVTPGNATRSGYYAAAGMGDIDGDGTADVIWVGSGGEVGYWLLNANGTMKSGGAVTAGNATRSGYYKAAAMADINGDGSADLLWVGNGGEVGYWLLNANGTLKTAGAVTSGNATRSGYYRVAGMGDINRDGTADIIWFGGGGEVGYWLLNPNGTLKTAGAVTPTKLTPTGYWRAAGVTDVNGDGTIDILWHGWGGETCFWLLNTNGTINTSGNIDTVPVARSSWTMRALGATSH